MFKLLNQPNPLLWVLLPLLTLLLWWGSWLDPFVFPTEQYLTTQLMHLQAATFSSLGAVLGGFLIMGIASLCILLNLNLNLVDSSGVVIGVLFLLLVSNLDLPYSHPVFLACILFMVALNQTLALSQTRNVEVTQSIFMSGTLVAVGAQFYHNLVFLLPIFWISYIILNRFSIRGFILSVFGFLLPYLYLFTIGYLLTDLTFSVQWEALKALYSSTGTPLVYNLQAYSFLGFAGLLVVFAALEFFGNYYKLVIQRRKAFRVLLLFLLVSVLLTVSLPTVGREMLVFAAVTASFFVARMGAKIKRMWLQDSIVWGLIALAIWNVIV